MSNRFNDKRKLFGTILGIILFGLTVMSITFAYYSWRSSNTDVTFSISDSTFTCETDLDSSISSLAPVTDYRNGTHQVFSVKNIGRSDTTFSLTMNISNISNVLKHPSFKYKLMLDPTNGSRDCSSTSVNNCELVGEGSFENVSVGMNTLVQSINLPNNSRYRYYFFMYLDGNMSNPTGIQNGTMTSSLGVCDIYTRLVPSCHATVGYDCLKLAADSTYGNARACSSPNGNAVGLPHSTKNVLTSIPTVVSYDSNASGITNPSSQTINYSFGGWYRNEGFTGSVVNNSSDVTSTENEVLYAKMNPSVTGGTITLPNLTRTGYNLSGWYTQTSGGTKVGNGGASYTPGCEKTPTLHAQWTAKTYTIGYTLNGGSNPSPKPTSGTYDADVRIGNPTKTVTVTVNANNTGATISGTVSKTQTFSGWTSTTLGSNALTGTSANPADAWDGSLTKNTYFKNLRESGTVTMVANWTAVKFDKLPKVTKAGHTCTINTKSDGTGTSYASEATNYTPDANSGASVTLYAICTANNYTITLNNQSATSDGTSTIYETYGVKFSLTSGGTAVTSITKPERTGYTFGGYYKDTSYKSGEQYIDANGNITAANTVVAANATWVAKWTKAMSSLTNTVTTSDYIYDGTAKCPTVSSKDGSTTLTNNTDYSYACSNNTDVGTATVTFAGKNVYNSTTKAFYSGTATVNFNINNATITFKKGTCDTPTSNVNLYTRKNATGLYSGIRNSTAASAPSASKTGYTFQGWYSGDSGGSKVLNANGSLSGTAVSNYTSATAWITTANRVLHAECTANTYTLTLNGNGATTNGTGSVQVTYNSSVLSPSTITLPQRTHTISFNMGTTGITKPDNISVDLELNRWDITAGGTQLLSGGTTPTLSSNVSGYTGANGIWTRADNATAFARWSDGSVTLPALNKTGYSCKWAEGSASGTQYVAGTSRPVTANKTYYAVCTANSYKVSFSSTTACPLNTTTYAQKTVNFDADMNIANPTCSGYTFDGWTANVSGGQAKHGTAANPSTTWNGTTKVKSTYFRNLTTTNNGTVTMTANWSAANYTLTFNGNGATTNGTGSVQVTYNSSTLSPSTITLPQKTHTISFNMGTTGVTKPSDISVNFDLDGWYTAQTGGSKLLTNTTTPALQNVNDYTTNGKWTRTSGATVYAHWSEESVTLPALSKTGETCKWAEGSASGTRYNPGTSRPVTANQTYYAICNANTYTLTYDCATNGGATNSTQDYVYNTAVDLTKTCAKAGWEHVGWAESSSATTKLNSYNMPAHDQTLYAIYKKAAIVRKITFNPNGNTSFTYNGTRKTATTTYDACTIPAVYNTATQATSCSATITMPTIEAHANTPTVKGWSTGPTTYSGYLATGSSQTITFDADKTYYAQTEKGSVDGTVTFKLNNNTNFTGMYGFNLGTTTYAADKTVTICTISETHNGTAQAATCTATGMMPTINPHPNTPNVIGWGNAQNAHTAAYLSGQTNVTLRSGTTWWAQSQAPQKSGSVTFKLNGNTNFIGNSGFGLGTTTYTADKTVNICTILATYNGTAQATTCTASGTMPTITAPSNTTTLIGWSNASGSYTASYTSGQANVTLTSGTTWYAQTSGDGNVTFYPNGNPKFTYNSTAYTATTSIKICTKHNGEASCNAKIKMPSITAHSNTTRVIGWSNAASNHTATYTSGQSNVTLTSGSKWYAQTSGTGSVTFNPNGNTKFTYNSTDYTETTSINICTKYNGAATCGAIITMPTITPPNTTPNVCGWTNGPTAHNGCKTGSQSITSGTTWYAQTYIDEMPKYATFYANGNSRFTYDGTVYTSSANIQVCTVPAAWNGAAYVGACSGTITMPTITAPANTPTICGWTNAAGTHTGCKTGSQTIVSGTSWYAQTKNSTDITVTFNKNGASTQTNASGTAVSDDAVTRSCTRYNGASGCSITSPTIVAANGFTVVGYNTSASATSSSWNHNTANTVSANATYHAITKSSDELTATIYYNSNTTCGSLTVATDTTAKCYKYNGASSCNVSIPSVVSGSKGKYNSPYKGVATAVNTASSVTSISLSGNTTYYTVYSQPLTIYYPNTSGSVSSNNTSLSRNEYFTSTTAMTGAASASSVTLTNLKGTFAGLAKAVNNYTTYYAINNSAIVNDCGTEYYAVTTDSETATIYYNSNTTAGSITPSTANLSVTSKFYCASTTEQGAQHGTSNMTNVPTSVTNSVGKYNTPYKGISASLSSMSPVTTFSGGHEYYAFYGGGASTGGTGAVNSNVTEYYSENNNSSGASYSQSFDYTGDIQTFTAPRAGYYKLETWGAEGGGDSTYPGGKGGYSSGIVHLNANETVYVVVGGKGNMTSTKVAATMPGGYNGGGNAFGHTDKYVGSGGGATHIAKATGVLSSLSSSQSSILLVAGGGGGGATQTTTYYGYGGAGGGINGYTGSVYGTTSVAVGAGGSQTAGGTGTPAAAFGIGGSSTGNGTGGGGGYYGGGAGKYYAGGGGGSGYVGGVTNGVMIAGDSVMPSPDGTTTTGREDNGYARITYYADNISELMSNYSYTGERQEFSAPEKGIYRLQLWGAQGGLGGHGGYTAGNLPLNSSDKLYMYVGQYGPSNAAATNVGGWNGGGYSGNHTSSFSYGGGGATDVRLANGSAVTTWNDATSLRSRIMVAGAGGGGFSTVLYTQNAGVGGNLTGGTGTGSYNATDSGGGTQTGAGTAYTGKQGLFGSGVQSHVAGYGGGGGGGYWGGSTGHGKPGGGGSSYISGYTGSVAVASASSNAAKSGCANGTTDISCSYHYSNKIFTDTVMIDGANSMPTYDMTSDMTGNSGNGYAKINKVGRNIYRNEFFTSKTAMNTVLSNSDIGTTNISTSNGAGNSSWYGYGIDGTTTRSYNSVSAAAQTTKLELYNIYQMQVNYQKGSNVAEIGSVTGNCLMSYSDYSCNSTTPSITPATGYSENGWSKTQDDANYGIAPSTSVPFSISNQTYFGNAKANDVTVFYDVNDDFANNIFTSINTGSGGGATTSFDSTNKIITINGAQTQSGWLQKITTSFASNDAYKVSLEYVSGSYTINSGSNDTIGFRFETRTSSAADISKRNALRFDWPTDSDDDSIQYLAISPESVAEAQILYVWMQCSSSKITFNNYKVRLKVEKISYRTETFGSNYHLPTTNPTWGGHTFIGWSYEETTITNSGPTIIEPEEHVVMADWKPNIIVTYSSGNLVTGLDDCQDVQAPTGTSGVYYMKYSISTNEDTNETTVTATNTRGAADGFGYTSGRVYLQANHTYRFNAETDGTWSTTENSGQVEAYLFLNGVDLAPVCGSTNFCHMSSNEDFEFTPLITGEYWLRLDVNESGGTYIFSNINIEEIVDKKSIPYNANSKYVLPSSNPTWDSHQFVKWYYSDPSHKVDSNTVLYTLENHTVYAQWNETYHVYLQGIGGLPASRTYKFDGFYNKDNGHLDNTLVGSSIYIWDNMNQDTSNYARIMSGTWGDDYLEFNGTNGGVNVNHGFGNKASQSAFTIESIVTLEGYPGSGNESWIIGNVESGGVGLGFDGAGRVKFQYWNGSAWQIAYGPSLVLGRKYHLIGTVNAGVIKIYVDGHLVTQQTMSGANIIHPATTNGVTNMWMGCNPGPSGCQNGYFKGKIYSVSYYVASITDDTINAAGLDLATNSSYGSLPEASRTGYTFAGWYDSTDFNNQVTSSSTFNKTEDTTLYAKWEANLNTTFYDDEYNVPISVTNGTTNGVTYSWDSNKHYLTLNGTESNNITLQNITSAFGLGDEWDIILRHVSGNVTQAGSACFVAEVYNGTSQLSTRNYKCLSYPTSGSITSTLTISTLGASSGTNLRLWLWKSGASGNTISFSNYVIQVDIVKRTTTYYNGTSWNDLARKKTGVVNNGTFVAPNGNNAGYLQTNGTNAWVNLGAVNLTKVTLEADVVMDSVPASGNACLVANYQVGGYGILIKNGYAQFAVHNSSDYVRATGTTAIEPGVRYKIAGVFDGSSVKLYVNGVLEANVAFTGTFKATTNNTIMTVGSDPNGSTGSAEWSNAKFYSVKVSNMALAQSSLGTDLIDSSTVRYYKVDSAKTHYEVLPEVSSNNYNLANGDNSVRGNFDAWYTATTRSSNIVTGTSKVPYNYDHAVFASYIGNAVQITYHLNGGEWAGSTNSSLGAAVYNNNSNDLVATFNGGARNYQSYEYGSTVNLNDWNNSNYINISHPQGKVAKDNLQWCTQANGGGTCYNQATDYSTNEFCDASSQNCHVDLYVNWVNVNCAAKGSTTSFAGRNWYTKTNDGSVCELYATAQSSATGTYSNSTQNLRNSYLKSGGADYGDGKLKTVADGGLLQRLGTDNVGDYFIDTNSGTDSAPSGQWWYASGNYRDSATRYKYATTEIDVVGGWQNNNDLGQLTVHRLSTTTYNAGNRTADNTVNTVTWTKGKYTQTQKTNGSDNRLSEWGTDYYFGDTDWGNGNGSSTRIKYLANRFALNASTDEKFKRTAAKLTVTICGGGKSNKTVVFTPVSSTKYHYKHNGTGTNTSYNYSGDRYFSAAGRASNTATSPTYANNFYSGGYCGYYYTYSLSNVTVTLHYRPRIKVNIN